MTAFGTPRCKNLEAGNAFVCLSTWHDALEDLRFPEQAVALPCPAMRMIFVRPGTLAMCTTIRRFVLCCPLLRGVDYFASLV